MHPVIEYLESLAPKKPAPMRVLPPVGGWRPTRKSRGRKPGVPGTKIAGRLKLFRGASRVDRALYRARRADAEIGRLATNSHEYKRAVASDRVDRRDTRRREIATRLGLSLEQYLAGVAMHSAPRDSLLGKIRRGKGAR